MRKPKSLTETVIANAKAQRHIMAAVAEMKSRVQNAAGAAEWVMFGIVEEVAVEFRLDSDDSKQLAEAYGRFAELTREDVARLIYGFEKGVAS